MADLAGWLPDHLDAGEELAIELAEDAVYAPYLERQEAELRDLRAGEEARIPAGIAYCAVPGLSNEMVERLTCARPETLAAASRIPGITPAALSALLVHARRVERADA